MRIYHLPGTADLILGGVYARGSATRSSAGSDRVDCE
jgi:hypothetical protein